MDKREELMWRIEEGREDQGLSEIGGLGGCVDSECDKQSGLEVRGSHGRKGDDVSFVWTGSEMFWVAWVSMSNRWLCL